MPKDLQVRSRQKVRTDHFQTVAKREARNISQICELVLMIGTEAYGKEGPKYIQRHIGHSKEG